MIFVKKASAYIFLWSKTLSVVAWSKHLRKLRTIPVNLETSHFSTKDHFRSKLKIYTKKKTKGKK